MSKLHIGETATAGLRLARRRPGVIVAWGLLLFALGMLPTLGLGASMVGPLHQMLMMEQSGGEPRLDDLLGLQAQVLAVQPVALLLTLALRSVVAGAVFCVVLRPEESAFAYLRFGKRELWLLLVAVVVSILGFLATLCAGVVAGVAVALAAMTGSDAATALVALFGGLAWLGGAVYVLVRLSMAFPMSFDEKTFRLFESWRLTRGHAGPLFLCLVLALVIVMAIELIAMTLFGVIGLLALGSGQFDLSTLDGFFARSPQEWIAIAAPWAVAIGLVASLVSGLLAAIGIAPLAEAYRELTVETSAETSVETKP